MEWCGGNELAAFLDARSAVAKRRAFGRALCDGARMTRFAWLFALAAACSLTAAENSGGIALFNGRDLSGWVNVNCAPETWSVREGVIHCAGKPIGGLRTVRQYENFALELDWRHLSSGGNSGIFVWSTPIAAPGGPFLRSIEVQVLDNGFNVPGKNEWYTTHGDVFPIHGATMKPFGPHNGSRSFPSEERSKSSPEWNHYRIVGSNGVLRLSVNGKEVSGGEECNYRKGYLGLESEGAPVEFRNIRVWELPSNGTSPELTAPVDLGWRTIFNGLDLRGWQTNVPAAGDWTVRGERLVANTSSADATLWTGQDFGDAEFVVDCRPDKPAAGRELAAPSVLVRGRGGKGLALKLPGLEAEKFQRFIITVKDREVTLKAGEKELQRAQLPGDAPDRGAFGLRNSGGRAEFMNIYARDLRP